MTADTHKEAHEMQGLDAVAVERGEIIFATLRDYRMSNMMDEDGGFYPLIDLMSNDGTSIATGEAEMLLLADDIAAALASAKPAQAGEVEALAKRLEGGFSGFDECDAVIAQAASLLRSQAGEVDRLTAERDALRAALAAPLQVPEIIEVGKAIHRYIAAESTVDIGAISYDAAVAVANIIRRRLP
jgi:hypothetical protein